jgi:hypothetical protein
MRVTIGNVTKIIPEEYWDGACMMTEDQLDAPKKLRLSTNERLLMAEMTWRLTQSDLVKEYIGDRVPESVIFQNNRMGDTRNVVKYNEIDGIGVIAIVPSWVMRAFPIGLRSEEDLNWVKV